MRAEKDPFQRIPGVGPNMARHLRALGCKEVADLCGQSPEELYRLDCARCGQDLDRCVLYVYRCAVYYAEHDEHDSEKLKWWNWKD